VPRIPRASWHESSIHFFEADPLQEISLRSIPTDARRAIKRAPRDILPTALVAPALLFVAVTVMFPMAYSIWNSTQDLNIGNLLTGETPFVGLDNYRRVLSEPGFWHALGISAMFTVGSLILQLTLGLAMAMFFARDFPLSGLLRSLVLVAWVLPPLVSGTLWRWMLDGDYGILNSGLGMLGLGSEHYWLTEPSTALLATVVANTWVGVPFNMLLLLVGLQNIPDAVYEAAKIDGASAWQRFRHVTLPLLYPVAITAGILGLIYTFKAFDIVFIMTGGGPVEATTVLPLYAYQLSFTFFRLGDGAAAATLLVAIPLALSVIYVHRMRNEEAA
jgi:multiple sugar transport system permease protein